MTSNALIGHTGFVGSHLRAGGRYDALFNSRNIAEIAGGRFGTVVCAGVSAVKWRANQEPERDLEGIRSLQAQLDTIEAAHVVLISTVDVYPDPLGVTEADAPDPAQPQAYGRHRLQLEAWVQGRFARTTIIRLPALFGTGLKKNILFDLITRHMTDRINPNGVFQWYPLRRFPEDLDTIVASGLPLVNLAVEPVGTRAIAERFFPGIPLGDAAMAPARYDMRTLHPGLLGGGHAHYHLDAAEILAELARYLGGPVP